MGKACPNLDVKIRGQVDVGNWGRGARGGLAENAGDSESYALTRFPSVGGLSAWFYSADRLRPSGLRCGLVAGETAGSAVYLGQR